MEDKTECRTPNRPRTTRIPTWKFDLLRDAILAVVSDAGKAGFPFFELPAAVDARLSEDDLARLGSLGWHVTTVKLEMEVRGDVAKLDNKSPQRLIVSKT